MKEPRSETYKPSLPTAARGPAPCPDPGALQRLLNATISTDPESFKHDPATCWWCQRGLKLVDCTQSGSHV